MRREKPKQSLFDTFIHWLCIAVFVFLGVRELSYLYRKPDSLAAHGAKYQRHFILSGSFPFVGSYFLMTPHGYDPAKSYPLLVILQGRSPHIYAADYMAYDVFRKRYASFVLVPIGPPRSLWETPENKDYSMKTLVPFPDAMPQVLDEIKEVMAEYNIDAKRLYLTGHSMGGMGVIGAMERYPGIFAGGTALSALWDPYETRNIDAPLWLFHGAQDRQISAQVGKSVAQALHAQKKPVLYDELPATGHDSWKIVYPNEAVWDWLYAQRRH